MINNMVAVSTGCSGGAVIAALTDPEQQVTSWVMAAGSIAATIVAWFIARRSEWKHAELRLEAEARAAIREQARLDGEAKRREQLEELIQLVTVRRATDTSNPRPAPPAEQT